MPVISTIEFVHEHALHHLHELHSAWRDDGSAARLSAMLAFWPCGQSVWQYLPWLGPHEVPLGDGSYENRSLTVVAGALALRQWSDGGYRGRWTGAGRLVEGFGRLFARNEYRVVEEGPTLDQMSDYPIEPVIIDLVKLPEDLWQRARTAIAALMLAEHYFDPDSWTKDGDFRIDGRMLREDGSMIPSSFRELRAAWQPPTESNRNPFPPAKNFVRCLMAAREAMCHSQPTPHDELHLLTAQGLCDPASQGKADGSVSARGRRDMVGRSQGRRSLVESIRDGIVASATNTLGWSEHVDEIARHLGFSPVPGGGGVSMTPGSAKPAAASRRANTATRAGRVALFLACDVVEYVAARDAHAIETAWRLIEGDDERDEIARATQLQIDQLAEDLTVLGDEARGVADAASSVWRARVSRVCGSLRGSASRGRPPPGADPRLCDAAKNEEEASTARDVIPAGPAADAGAVFILRFGPGRRPAFGHDEWPLAEAATQGATGGFIATDEKGSRWVFRRSRDGGAHVEWSCPGFTVDAIEVLDPSGAVVHALMPLEGGGFELSAGHAAGLVPGSALRIRAHRLRGSSC